MDERNFYTVFKELIGKNCRIETTIGAIDGTIVKVYIDHIIINYPYGFHGDKIAEKLIFIRHIIGVYTLD